MRLTSLKADSAEAGQEDGDPGADASGSATPSGGQAEEVSCSGRVNVPDWSEVDKLLGTAGCAAVRQYFDQLAAYEEFQSSLPRVRSQACSSL